MADGGSNAPKRGTKDWRRAITYDFVVRGLSTIGLARKYGVQRGEVETAIRREFGRSRYATLRAVRESQGRKS